VNKKVWIFQYKKDVAAKGQDKASWYVGWYDLAGKRHCESCGPGARGKNQAEKRLRRVQSELDTGLHRPHTRIVWAVFQAEYDAQILAGLAPKTRLEAQVSLNHFQRIIRPGRLEAINTQTIDTFIAKRRQEPGKKPGSLVSPATINKDLRHLKAALHVAREWGYLAEVPKVRMVREPEKLPRYVTPEHFGVLYHLACPLAKFPEIPGGQYGPADWWRALVVTGYMTGLRISEMLAIKCDDMDLKNAVLITRAADNKGKRDEVLPLHSVVVAHLQKIRSNAPLVFPWPHDPRTLWVEFGRIQRAAGIHLPCPEQHRHTDACHVYGFHDLRRAFATVNAPRLKPEALQRLMRHKSYKTTLGYINLANQVEDAVRTMPVPGALQQD
jgi:integrase